LIHGFDASRFLVALPDGSAGFRLLRDPEGLRDNASLAIWFVNNGTRLMIGKFVPEEKLNFINWESGINQRLERLDRFELKHSVLP